MTLTRRAVTVATAILLAAGCSGDHPFAAAAVAGHYQLETVNGRPLPYMTGPCNGCVQVQIFSADLLLRADQTFKLGMFTLQNGTFRLDGERIRMTIPPFEPGAQGGVMTGAAAGDSVVIEFEGDNGAVQYLFRKAPRREVPVSRGTYPLTSVNGRSEPFILYETVTSSGRQTTRVVFDTLEFIDGVFYRRHREVEQRLYLTDGRILSGGHGFEHFGTYGGRAGEIVLHPYQPFESSTPNDTLTVENGSLFRRRMFGTTPAEERYDRR